MSPERLASGERGALPGERPAAARGAFVAVVGPSGAGKDTLMALAARHPGLDGRIAFARRAVTRPALAEAEDHDSLDDDGFARAEAAGRFSLVWAAHGLRYGLPRSVEDDLAAGRTVAANLSRRSLAAAAEVFGGLHVVEVTARPEVLLARLSARGRETEATIRDRLSRGAPALSASAAASRRRIDNSGDLGASVDAMVLGLNAIARGP